MATMEDTVNAMRLEIDNLKVQMMTRDQGQQLVQDANARELVHLQKGIERDETMRKHEEELQKMVEATENIKVRMTNAESKTTDERKCIGYINMKNKEPKVFGENPMIGKSGKMTWEIS